MLRLMHNKLETKQARRDCNAAVLKEDVERQNGTKPVSCVLLMLSAHGLCLTLVKSELDIILIYITVKKLKAEP